MNRTWTAELVRNSATGKNELVNERYEYLFCDDLWREIKSFLIPKKEEAVFINYLTQSLAEKRDAPVELPEVIETIIEGGAVIRDKKFATQLRALVRQWGKKRPLDFYYGRPERSVVDCDDTFCFLLSTWVSLTLHYRKKDLREMRAEYIQFFRELDEEKRRLSEAEFVELFWRSKGYWNPYQIPSQYLTQSLRWRLSNKYIRNL